MLILTRKPGQMLRIVPHESLDLSMPVYELFQPGPIEVLVSRIEASQVRLGIVAHPGLLILREELVAERAEAVRRKWMGVKRG